MPEEIERWDPFREMMTLRNRVDHLFESMFARPRGEWLATIFDYPAMDMYESDGTIKGERKAREEVKEERYYRKEMHYGIFTRSVTLPEMVDVAKPEASFENGVLTVSFPKLKTVEPKRIEIKQTEPKARHVG